MEGELTKDKELCDVERAQLRYLIFDTVMRLERVQYDLDALNRAYEELGPEETT